MAEKSFRIKRPKPENGDAINQACEIIQALLLTADSGHDSRGGLAAFNGMREISEEFCKACERKGQVLHMDGFCDCPCHIARKFIAEHRKKAEAA